MKYQRYLIAILVAVGLMLLGDALLVILGLPQWIRLTMMSVLGWITGIEIRDWLNKTK